MHSNKQVSIHGNIKDLFFQLRYNSRPLLSGYLSEFIGLISGVKNIAALETSDPYLAKKLLDMLHTLDPTKKFCSLTTKGYHWIKKHNVDYKYNVFIGQRGENLKQFDKYYKSPKEYCDEVGEGLSYPICCTRASWINKSYTDFFQIDKVNEIDYRINNFYNRGGSNLSIIRHYVCNYNCQESIDYAQRVLLFVEKRFPELHSQYNKILKMPLLILYKDKSPHRTVGDSVSFSFN